MSQFNLITILLIKYRHKKVFLCQFQFLLFQIFRPYKFINSDSHNFNRLEFVKDESGNILKETKYHHKD